MTETLCHGTRLQSHTGVCAAAHTACGGSTCMPGAATHTVLACSLAFDGRAYRLKDTDCQAVADGLVPRSSDYWLRTPVSSGMRRAERLARRVLQCEESSSGSTAMKKSSAVRAECAGNFRCVRRSAQGLCSMLRHEAAKRWRTHVLRGPPSARHVRTSVHEVGSRRQVCGLLSGSAGPCGVRKWPPTGHAKG